MHEYAQFASIIKKLLVFRHQKHAQVELTQDALEHKRASLEDLEKNEREASRLEEALGRGRSTGPLASVPSNGSQGRFSENTSSADGSEQGDPQSPERPEDRRISEGVFTPPYPEVSPPPRRSGSGMGLLNALSYTLHGMMDVDPETARRNAISKTRESISQVSILFLWLGTPVFNFAVIVLRVHYCYTDVIKMVSHKCEVLISAQCVSQHAALFSCLDHMPSCGFCIILCLALSVPPVSTFYLCFVSFRLTFFLIPYQLEDALHLAAQDLKYSNSTIQADLDRFQRQKVADIREMCLAMARSHRDWCKKVNYFISLAASAPSFESS